MVELVALKPWVGKNVHTSKPYKYREDGIDEHRT
jgi:hypothetical protein